MSPKAHKVARPRMIVLVCSCAKSGATSDSGGGPSLGINSRRFLLMGETSSMGRLAYQGSARIPVAPLRVIQRILIRCGCCRNSHCLDNDNDGRRVEARRGARDVSPWPTPRIWRYALFLSLSKRAHMRQRKSSEARMRHAADSNASFERH